MTNEEDRALVRFLKHVNLISELVGRYDALNNKYSGTKFGLEVIRKNPECVEEITKLYKKLYSSASGKPLFSKGDLVAKVGTTPEDWGGDSIGVFIADTDPYFRDGVWNFRAGFVGSGPDYAAELCEEENASEFRSVDISEIKIALKTAKYQLKEWSKNPDNEDEYTLTGRLEHWNECVHNYQMLLQKLEKEPQKKR